MFKITQKQSLRFLLPLSLAVIAILVGLSVRFSAAQSGAGASHPSAFSHALPQLDGSHLRATVVEVNYAPGRGRQAAQPSLHRDRIRGPGCDSLPGKGRPRGVFKAGESFYEPPNGVHEVSANASDKEPAKLIAFFVCDHETVLTMPPMDGR